MLAVFDFDGTLAYTPSTVLFFKFLPAYKKFLCPLTYYAFSVLGLEEFHGDFCSGGADIQELIELGLRIPPIEQGIELAREFADRGYEIAVMSFSLKKLIERYLEEHGIEATVYAKEVRLRNGKIVGYSRDFVTRTLNRHRKSGKKIIVEKLGIKADVCVGDNPRRDVICDNFIDIRKFDGYPSKLTQFREVLKLII